VQVKDQYRKSKVQSSFCLCPKSTLKFLQERCSFGKEALKLSPVEKAQIIDALWQSLDPAEQKSIDRAWLDESQNRLKAFHAGEIKALDGEETLCSIRSELGK
jgi:putative addiction module component (TIGR02574 family)